MTSDQTLTGNPFAPELLIEEVGGVRVVTLNRPDEMNAANDALHRGLIDVWRHLAADPNARAVVITGAGQAFSAGGDFAHLQHIAQDRELRRGEIAHAAELVREMSSCPLPIVAAVNGPAVGLGCNVAILSDIVLIAEDTYLADPHVSIGLTAADGGAPIWPLYMSLLKAKEYLLTGDRIPAKVAVELGLANRTVQSDSLLDEAMSLAVRLGHQPVHALQATKRALNMHLERAIHGILEYALAEEFKNFDDAEHQRIVNSFLEKRLQRG